MVTVCVMETTTQTRHIFRDLLHQIFTHCSVAELRNQTEVVSNASFSQLLAGYEDDEMNLPELFQKIEQSAEAEEGFEDTQNGDPDDPAEDGAQFIVDAIGELATEAIENMDEDTFGYVVFPDPVYGRLLGFFSDNYQIDDEVQVLTINEAIYGWLNERMLETNQPLPWFGIIGGYGLAEELGSTNDTTDCTIMGRRLPNDSYRLIEMFLRPDWSNQEQVEDAFVGQVRQLVNKFGISHVLIADETLECTLLGLKEEVGEDYYVAFFNQDFASRCNYLSNYRGAWQGRMQHLYSRDDWPEGVKLESALTLYAEAIVAKVGQDFVSNQIKERGQKIREEQSYEPTAQD